MTDLHTVTSSDLSIDRDADGTISIHQVSPYGVSLVGHFAGASHAWAAIDAIDLVEVDATLQIAA